MSPAGAADRLSSKKRSAQALLLLYGIRKLLEMQRSANKKHEVFLTVRDCGPGRAEKKQKIMFTDFFFFFIFENIYCKMENFMVIYYIFLEKEKIMCAIFTKFVKTP